ncbi:hypothetical protein NEISICOT_01555 [Neisseria sicca ATCC 29256]|uniref:Uncharacterized protein n=1 Tax=Neisseria sicca ATCC 29256 TaxID=547045 RepID=C6M4V6_NEISI|nr:hypothetical protein NEISICOT_01555 [Neisseria sicca ATCC 29256]
MPPACNCKKAKKAYTTNTSITTKTKQYSGLNLNQDKATKPQTVQIVRQGEATPYWFKVKPLYIFRRPDISQGRLKIPAKKSVPPFSLNVDTQSK